MNRLEEIQEIIKNFIYEKQRMKQEITDIEEKRTQLAKRRNETKAEYKGKAYTENVEVEISELGKTITELGNRSQEIQNKLDLLTMLIKEEVSSEIDYLIAEGMLEIRSSEDEVERLKQAMVDQQNRTERYMQQKQVFFERFGRMPELSASAQKENQEKEEEYKANEQKIEKLIVKIEQSKQEIAELAQNKRAIKNNKWEIFANPVKVEIKEESVQDIVEEETIVLPFVDEVKAEKIAAQEQVIEMNEEDSIQEAMNLIEEIMVEDVKPVEEIKVEEVAPIEELIVEEITPVEEIEVEEMQPIEEIAVEEFAPVEEIKVEEMQPIEEIAVEEFAPVEEVKVEEMQPIEEITVEEFAPIEEVKAEEIVLAEKDVEEVEEFGSVEQIQNIELQQVEQINKDEVKTIEPVEQETEIKTINENYDIKNIQEENTIAKEEEIITLESFEEEKTKNEITTFNEKVTLLNIVAKIENKEVVYITQVSNGETITIYPTKGKNLLSKDKENREELKSILINYAIAEYKALDKKVIKKIDPIICEILVKFAKEYNYDAQNLIYNYAMSFSKNEEIETENIPHIIYNLYFSEEVNMNKKEKETLAKICKNARKNERIEIIGSNSIINKIKYIFKRTFNINTAEALPEVKC